MPTNPAVRAPAAAGTSTSAPAKLILCGEHAVVYQRPAIALPLAGIRARVKIAGGRPGRGVLLIARNLRRSWYVADEPANPLSELVVSVLTQLGARTPDLHIAIVSSIPIASGMGSGAAVATALVRGLAEHVGQPLAPADISALVYASEQRFHGTPSGIDNSVIAYEQPIWFQRGGVPPPPGDTGSPGGAALIAPITIAAPFTLLVGDTGVRSATRAPVGEVRQRWLADPAPYEALFGVVGALVVAARTCLAHGQLGVLGGLLSQNHALLQQIGVSSPELDLLVDAAQAAGALGAKLSGAGWGGVMLALVDPTCKAAVAHALKVAGARRVIETLVEAYVP
jgi:mevalonate kinase